MPQIILASSSPYRRQLLDKLGLDYQWQAPDIDEQPRSNELPEALVQRLAQQKAVALANSHPNHLIIGSDQVAVLNGQILGKPKTFEKAQQQLNDANGKTVIFLTGLCLFNSSTHQQQLRCEHYSVTFRTLSAAEIQHYLIREQPFDCAGSFKAEGLGISLFTRMEGNDPNTLIGLPLIALIDMLKNEGVEVLN